MPHMSSWLYLPGFVDKSSDITGKLDVILMDLTVVAVQLGSDITGKVYVILMDLLVVAVQLGSWKVMECFYSFQWHLPLICTHHRSTTMCMVAGWVY